jgi:hypothetical protein
MCCPIAWLQEDWTPDQLFCAACEQLDPSMVSMYARFPELSQHVALFSVHTRSPFMLDSSWAVNLLQITGKH